MPEGTVTLGGAVLHRIGLGTNRLVNTPENVAFVREGVAAGVNLIDTAHTYTGGRSEEAIGAALSPLPEGCVVATKGGYAPGTGRPEALREQIELSLRRLRTDCIPLYYLHRVDPKTPLEESAGALKESRDAGKIRHVGLSQVGIDQIERAGRIVPIAAVQNEYNISERGYDEIIDHCAERGIVFVPYSPLESGAKPAIAAIAAIAARHGATPAQVRLAWLLRRSPLTLPIPGTLSREHLLENLAALQLRLSDEEFGSLSRIASAGPNPQRP